MYEDPEPMNQFEDAEEELVKVDSKTANLDDADKFEDFEDDEDEEIDDDDDDYYSDIDEDGRETVNSQSRGPNSQVITKNLYQLRIKYFR